MAKISSVTKRVIWRRLFCSLLLPARCRWHKSARNQENGLARLLSTLMLARGHAEWSQRRGRRPERERKPLTKGSEALGRRHSRHRERARGKNKQLGLSQRISKARAPAQTQSTHHFEGKDEDAEKGESSQLLAQRKQQEEEQWMEGENDVKAQGARFFFFSMSTTQGASIFSCPPPRFFFLSRPPLVHSLSSRERRARTNNHFFDRSARRSGKKNVR